MQNNAKIRTSIWISPHLLLLLNERGLTLSSFIGRTLPAFLDLPEDPREKMIQKDLDTAVLRARSTYEREMRELIKQNDADLGVQDLEKIKEAELREFGEYLQRSSAYPVFRKCLMRRDPDDDTLSIVTREVNKMNGRTYEETELWNQAVTWFRKYGDATAKKVPV